jgi:chromosome segregation ATPase
MTNYAEILDLLRQVNQKLDHVDQKVDRVDQKVDRVEQNLSQKVDRVEQNLSQKIDHIDQEHGRALELLRQDMTMLRQDATITRGAVSGHASTVRNLLQEARVMRMAVGDIAKEKITPGEIDVLHEDVTRLHMQVSELKGRVQILEGHGER